MGITSHMLKERYRAFCDHNHSTEGARVHDLFEPIHKHLLRRREARASSQGNGQEHDQQIPSPKR
ncbi:MAG: hypothetical protein RhofKO_37810 [Rhodothermales bacterium]